MIRMSQLANKQMSQLKNYEKSIKIKKSEKIVPLSLVKSEFLDILLEKYNLSYQGDVSYNERLSWVKSQDENYMVREVFDTGFIKGLDTIKTLNLNFFEEIVVNTNSDYVTSIGDKKYILTRFYPNYDNTIAPLKMKFHAKALSYVHNNSCFEQKISNSYFENKYLRQKEKYDEFKKLLIEKLEKIESSNYKTPSEWQLLVNANIYFDFIEEGLNNLNEFKESSTKLDGLRQALIYNNFKLERIKCNDEKILNITKIKFDGICDDILDVFYKTNYDLSLFNTWYLEYEKNFKLLDYEKKLLCAQIYSLDNVIDNNEANSLNLFSRNIKYMKQIKDFSNYLQEKK